MLSKLRPPHRIALGAVLACALVGVTLYVAEPLQTESPTSLSTDLMSAHTSIRSIESDEPLTDETFPPFAPEPASEVSSSPSNSTADRGILLARECLTLAERDPLAAMEMAAENHLHEVDPGLAASLMAQWAAKDFDRAYAWTKAQAQGTWRDDMLARLAFVRSKASPVVAARLIVSDIPAGRARDEAVISVVHQWALQDASGAMRWVQSFPDEPLRERASAEIAGIAAASSRSNGTR